MFMLAAMIFMALGTGCFVGAMQQIPREPNWFFRAMLVCWGVAVVLMIADYARFLARCPTC